MRMYSRRVLLLVGVALVALAFAAVANAARYTVVYKSGQSAAATKAIAQAGGSVVVDNKIVGVATARSSTAGFAAALRTSSAIVGVGNEGFFYQGEEAEAAAPPGTFPSVPTVATGCGQQYQPPGGTGVGPDPLSVCQWDMRMINASPTGSYAVNQGAGATVGIMDTGLDAFHPDIAPNLDQNLSCSFIKPGNPTAQPQEIAPLGRACGPANQSKWQDYNGHGTHVGGTVAAPINGVGVAGVAPAATLVTVKAGTAEGYFFTQEVVDALTYSGEVRLDAVNMSFFADPWLFNCHNDKDQQAIIKAISRAAQYAHSNGVVLVASAGNESEDLDHPGVDVISPDFPPGSEIERDVGNNCIVLPAELPWVNTVSAVGPQKRLSFYSSYGNSKVDVTAPGGSSDQAPNPFGRVLNAWSSTADFTAGGNPTRTVEDCTPTCVYYAWIQGTSMASPHAAGVAALIRSADPDLPPTAVEARMQQTAMAMYCPEGDDRCLGSSNANGNPQTSFYGNGLVDALAAGLR